ncbi:MAG TPA: type 2 isopentenyl-diphosphate Delta-isomerase [Spirochaetia bacterium]|nr:type 2 isopentenyl-diphosphate Delta-isomerase [Spirochaetia bacterium]
MGGNDNSIGERKAQHLEICADAARYDVEGGRTLLDSVRFVHRSLPEVDEPEVDLTTTFLDHSISMPLFISSMTGGSAEGYQVNKTLAQVAQAAGVPVGMGSIRILYRKPEVIDHFMLKRIAPDVPVFANIGGVQLLDPDQQHLVELIRRLEVDAIAVHLNPGQELAQPEGDRNFRGVLDGIARLCDLAPVPVIVKETGFGIGRTEALQLVDRGVRYVDVAGSGGTNWVTVEGYRMSDAERAVADEFRDWGIPTGVALAATRDLHGRMLASGGLRTGLDIAKCLALGAVAGGLALPFVREIRAGGFDAGLAFAERMRSVLRTAMVLTGSRTVADLRDAPLFVSPEFRTMTDQLAGASHDA